MSAGSQTKRPTRGGLAPLFHVRSAVAIVALAALLPATVAVGQELPPGPTTLQPLTRSLVGAPVARSDEAQVMVLDFAPGAWTPLHQHGGLTLVRVLHGEMTRNAHGVIDVFGPGEGWTEEPNDVHAVGNRGDTPARVLVTFLLPTGSPLTTVAGSPTESAPPGPTTAFQSRRVPVTSPADSFDESATTMLGFAPRAWTPTHSHGGLTLVGVVDGEMTVRGGSGEVVYRPGDLWIEQPGDVHAAGNANGSDAQVSVTFLLQRGSPVTTIAAAQAPAQLPTALPRAGDASTSYPLLATAAAFALATTGLYLRRRGAVRDGSR